eukprot:CAMPEP_0203680560 /NCGR_PEP_ID=MMETSP0090-20130426/39682_1 /ASSEMBLY_ACC=CAM_ASM_001088 /TAXON_ID=426623 /ORGANISM="Chaetoceros affinis, Strain CCMP159" /LENGTH=557 /DNA_ID=CAMNT_0050548679 /DNA_START=163 /DNA_END=1836 /DNA_ORIENTATION=-
MLEGEGNCSGETARSLPKDKAKDSNITTSTSTCTAPSEVICVTNNSNSIPTLNSNSNSTSFHDEEEGPANDRTLLLKGGTHDNTKKNSSRNNTEKANSDSHSHNDDNDKFIFATFELKKAIQHKPWLSAYIMFSTLFFGFAMGFASGYLVYEQGYFRNNGSENGNGNTNWNTVSASTSAIDDYYKTNVNINTKSGIQEGDVTVTTSISQSMSVRENHNESERTKEKKDKVLEFLDKHIFRDIPSSSTSSESEAAILQQTPLLRFPFQGGSSTPRPLIYLNRPDAYSLLIDSMSGGTVATMSEYSNDFFLLSSGLDAQVNQAYCGVSSAVAVLNSLRFLKSTINDDGVNIPVDPVYNPYPYATQIDIFDECTKAHVISHTGGGPGVDGILSPPYGLSMPQISGLLRCHLNATTSSGIGWSVQEQYVDKSHITPGKMRFDLKNALSDPNSRVLVNYDRSAIGQVGGGHWSPVGSYSEKQDAFLILDVAKYKYPPVWIPTERLFDGLATYDDCGLWDFPSAQDKLSQEERMAHTEEGYAATMSKLGCQKELRGYITVTRT